jgi:UDP-N-acetylmuramate: L-alanyl-gamma-D-glutamyl-meso-diaminopimelate ligase
VINNLEFDHADIFDDLEAIRTSFRRFINLVPRNGLLLGNGDDPNLEDLLEVTHCPVKRFGLGETNAVRAFNLNLAPTASEFEIPSFKFHLNLLGELNVRNALAVVACAKHCGLKNSQIQSAFDTFKGIKRRMEVRGIAGGVTVIDDFGHHPTAIRETLKALRLRSVLSVKPGGTARPSWHISARLAPLPPNRSFIAAVPSVWPAPKP